MIKVLKLTECGSLMYAELSIYGINSTILTKHTAVKMLLNDLYLDQDDSQSKLYTLVGDINSVFSDELLLNSVAQLYVERYGECDPLFYTI